MVGCFPVDHCEDVLCGPCPPPLSIEVRDPNGQGISGVTITGEQGSCSEPTANLTSCQLDPTVGAGTHTFEIGAPGFQTQEITETVEVSNSGGCCSCGYDPKTIQVTLEPA